METQGNLFDDSGNAVAADPVVMQSQPGAGVINRNEVFRDTYPRHTGRRAEILRYIAKMADVGATRDEISEALGLPLSSVCGRVNELMNCNPPAVRETNERRMTRYGKPAVVVVKIGE
jgi:hypothetical protein